MVPVMIEAICGQTPATAEIELEVREYVEQSTGILTILQMEWLVEAVRQHGLAGPPLTAAAYKARYLERLMVGVRERIQQVETGACQADDRMLRGARDFLAGLQERGVQLYLISGTDHADVQREAGVLGLADTLPGASTARWMNARPIRRSASSSASWMSITCLAMSCWWWGMGRSKSSAAHGRGAIALGVASDEVARAGWNEHKVARLRKAGADLLIPDFSRRKSFSACYIPFPISENKDDAAM